MLLLAVLAAVLGFMKGFVRQAGSLAGVVIGIIVCRVYGPDAVRWLQHVASADSGAAVTACAYAGLFILVYLACILASGLVRKLVSGLHLGLLDRLAGAVFKVFVWALLVSIALNVWVAFMPDSRPSGAWARRVEKLAPAVAGMALAEMPDLPKKLNL